MLSGFSVTFSWTSPRPSARWSGRRLDGRAPRGTSFSSSTSPSPLFCSVRRLLAWVYRQAEGLKNRAIITWSVLSLASLGVDALLKNVGAPISAQTAITIIMLLAVFFLLPSLRGKRPASPLLHMESRGPRRCASLCWLRPSMPIASLSNRVEKFVSLFQLKADSLGALPLPPSIWHWDGLVNTPHGVFEVRLDLSDSAAPGSIEHRYYPDAFPNRYHRRGQALARMCKLFCGFRVFR